MARKKWVQQTEITPSLLKLREKRKWQISFRRYVLEKNLCPQYAPFFGLDIEKLRKWFELQFKDGMGWDDFAKTWQFEHVIPVSYFNFADDADLKLCWNFLNIRIGLLTKEKGNGLDGLASKRYFEGLYQKTQYKPCLMLLEKIDNLQQSEIPGSEKQCSFITENSSYLERTKNYSSLEFELLNSGRSIDEVSKEADFLKKF